MIQDESKKYFRYFTKVAAFLTFFVLAHSQVFAKAVDGSVSRIGDATHLEFYGLDQWNYTLERTGKNEFTLIVPEFSQKMETELRTWTGQFIEGIKVSKNGSDQRYKVTFKVTDGKVESFDYLTDEPSRLIIDFFKQVEPEFEKVSRDDSAKKEKLNKQKKKISKGVRKTKFQKENYTKYERNNKEGRKPAGELDPKYSEYQGEQRNIIEGDFPQRGAFDGGDPGFRRFRMKNYEIDERSIIASRQNFYIRFPMLKMPTSQFHIFLDTRPEYIIKEKNTKENKEARLLLKLHKNNRPGLFFKTYRYFKDKYPKSDYSEIIDHLAAEMHFDRYVKAQDVIAFQQAQSIYRTLLQKYPNSPLAERTELILGYAALESGSGIDTIQSFQAFLKKRKNSEYRDQAKKSIAAGLLVINKYAAALKMYQSLAKEAENKVEAVEAFYRIGDVHFQKRDYEKAIASYKKALEKYPNYESRFPNAHFNIAESNFWLGKYKSALDHYIEFMTRFPSHFHGGYAMTRIGENLDILGADRAKVMGAFLESYFRYRNNPGSKVARIRMLSQRMKGMKQKELTKALDEIEAVSESSSLPRIKEFVTLMVAKGFDKRSEFKKAMNLLITHYQKNPTSTDLEFFKQRILNGIAEVINQEIENNQYMNALQFNDKYTQTWLRNSDRMDIPYFIGRAYEQAGVYGEAKKSYKATIKGLTNIKGTSEETARRVTERIPTIDEVNLRISKSHMELREYPQAVNALEMVDLKNLRREEDKVELVSVQAEVFERRGRIALAKSSLSKLEEKWKGDSKLLAPVLFDLSRLRVQTGELVDAIQSIEKIEEIKNENKEIDDDLWAKTLQLKAEVLEKQGKNLAAVEVYTELLKSFESKRPLGAVRYKAGQLLYEKGDVRGAEKIWESLDSEKQSLFRKLADERLRDAKWQGNYKKYINRIPAMAGQK